MALSALAKSTFHDSLRSVKPTELVKANVLIRGEHLVVKNAGKQSEHSFDLRRHRNILVLGAGKASQEMCHGLFDIFATSEAVKTLNVQVKAFVNIPKDQKVRRLSTTCVPFPR